MKVSIITVTFNSERTIEDTIRSVVSQSHKDIEYILIDGASTDRTLEILKDHSLSIAHLLSEPDSGLYDAMNKGIALAQGEIIGILNSDDVYQDENVIHDVVSEFERYPIDCVYGDLVYVDHNDLNDIKRYWPSGTYHRKAFLNGWMPPHPAWFVKSSCYKAFGNYDISFKSAADYELMLRFMYKNHCSASHIDRVLVRMRVGGQSNSNLKNRMRANQEDRRAWARNGLKPRFYTLTLKPFRKLGQFFNRPGQMS